MKIEYLVIMVAGVDSEQGNRPLIYVAVFLLFTAIFLILLSLVLREPNKPFKVVQNGNATSEQPKLDQIGSVTSEQSKKEGDDNKGKDSGGIGLDNAEEEGGLTDVTATNALTLFVPPKLFDTPNTPGRPPADRRLDRGLALPTPVGPHSAAVPFA